MKTLMRLSALIVPMIGTAALAADDPAANDHSTAAAALQALRADPSAQFEMQQDWI